MRIVLSEADAAAPTSINGRELRAQSVTFLHHDLERACRSLDDRQQVATIFNAPMTLFTADEVAEMLEGQGYTVAAHVGIRCICDYWGTTWARRRTHKDEPARRRPNPIGPAGKRSGSHPTRPTLPLARRPSASRGFHRPPACA